jgi:cell division protein YceG involved in septum cleavage
MTSKGLFKGVAFVLAVFTVLVIGVYVFQNKASGNLSEDDHSIFTVEAGDTIGDVARKLKDQHIITFESLFHLSRAIYGQEAAVAPGAYELSQNMSLKQVVHALDATPYAESVSIPADISRNKMGEIMAKSLGWKDLDKQFFGHTLAGMQWQRYKDQVESEFLRRYNWTQSERETFLSLSSTYDDEEYDIFKHVYEPGTYQIPLGSSRAQAAAAIIDKFALKHGDSEYADMVKLLDVQAMDSIAALIKGEMELLPDIVSLPPSDVTLKTEKGRTYLLFTTAYWNKGRGPLEMVVDPKTKNIKSDIERKVFQRIYRLDGDYRERLSGSFLWHQAHLHYHFTDFAKYTLTVVDTDGKPFKTFAQAKATFCLRDSEPVDLTHPGSSRAPSYTICGKERQGISPGWADAYYYTYIDQRFDVTDAPNGKYLITILTNPDDRFEEVTKENNKAEALILLNVKDDFVKVLEERSYGK